MTLQPHPEAVSKRLLCTTIRSYPFDTRVIFGALNVPAFQHDCPLSRLVQFLTKYEADVLFWKYDQTTQGMRRALGCEMPTHSSLSPEVAAKLRAIDSAAVISKVAWDDLCALFTIYRLIDTFTACGNFTGRPSLVKEVEQLTFNEPCQRRLEETMISNIRGWEWLKKWPDLLSQARNVMERPQAIPDQTPISNPVSSNPHLSHLAGLSKRSVCHKYYHILDNFQAAALHLSYILKMPGKAVDGTLPDLPNDLNDLLNVPPEPDVTISPLDHPSLDPTANEKATKKFLAGLSPHQLRLPLQYALTITPLCLLFGFSLHRTKCDRESLFKAAVALGNLRPEAVREVENEILTTLFRISSRPMDLKTEIKQLVSSEKWKRLEVLPASDPASCFFNPLFETTSAKSRAKEVSEGDLRCPSPLTLSVSQKGHQAQSLDSTVNDLGEKCTYTEGSNHGLTKEPIAGPMSGSQNPEDDVEMSTVPEDRERGRSLSGAKSIIEKNAKILDDINVRRETEERAAAVVQPDGDTARNMDTDDFGERMVEEEDTNTNDHDKNPHHTSNVVSQADGSVTDPLKCSLGPNPLRQSARIQQTKMDQVQRAPETVDDTPQHNKRPNKKPNAKKPTTRPETPKPDKEDFKDIIDVDLWTPKEVTLNVEQKPLKFFGREVVAYGPGGETTQFTLQAHDHETLYITQRLWAQVESAYEDQKPLHLSNPPKSGFLVLTQEKAANIAPSDWLSALKTQNLVIIGGQNRERPFKKALQDLGAPSTVMTIQDQSIPAHDNYNKRCLQGTFSQILEASRSPDGKILNALDIGLPASGLKETGYSSNVSALMATRGQWKTTKPMPMNEVSFALACSGGAFHTWHIDCNGFLTFVTPICGRKLWLIARPHVKANFGDFANIDIFLGEFNLDKANENLWTIEAILLNPGDTLIMRPNTPHSVYTPEATVVHGGHCYASSTLQESLVGMIHAFMTSSFITNTNHLSARFHLQQMIDFYHLALVQNGLDEDDERRAHVPDCRSGDDFVNLMAICIFGILINVLDFATYQYPGIGEQQSLNKLQRNEMIQFDTNALSDEDRLGCIYTRGRALQIMDFVARNYKIDQEDDLSRWQNLQAYQEHIIIHQCQMLYNYKNKAKSRNVRGAPGCSLDLLKTQLSGVLDGEVNVKIAKSLKITSNTQMLLPKLRSGLVRVDTPLPIASTKSDPMVLGISIRDKVYRDGRRIKFEANDESLGTPPRKRQKTNIKPI